LNKPAAEGVPSVKAERSKLWAVVSIICLGTALAVLLLVVILANVAYGDVVALILTVLSLLCLLSAIAALVFGALGSADPLGKATVIAVVVLTVAAASLLIPGRAVVTTTTTLGPAVDPWSQDFAPLP
jgi:hypothetical protein